MGLLNGKTVVVTGAGRGIGRAIAVDTAREGAAVVVADFGATVGDAEPGRADVAEEVAAQIRAEGGRAVAINESVTKMVGARRIVQTAIDNFGRLDGVVCSAGNQRPAPFLEMSEDDWDAVINTHLRGHFTMFQTAARKMAQRGTRGSLVAIGSGYLSGTPTRANYRAAKAGVVALTFTVAMELADAGIRANCIAPAANTRMTEVEGIKIRGEATDIAPMATFLLSDSSEAVNGQIFSVAGGRIAGWADPYEDRTMLKDGTWTVAEIGREISGLVHQHPSDGAGVLLSGPIN